MSQYVANSKESMRGSKQFRYGKKTNKITDPMTNSTSSKDFVSDIICECTSCVCEVCEAKQAIRIQLENLEESFYVTVTELEHQMSNLRDTLEELDIV